MTISINAAARAAHRWGRLSLLRPERCAAGGHRSWRARRRAKPLGNCTRASRGARMPMAWADGEQPSPRGNERPRMDDQATTSSCDYPQSASDPPSSLRRLSVVPHAVGRKSPTPADERPPLAFEGADSPRTPPRSPTPEALRSVEVFFQQMESDATSQEELLDRIAADEELARSRIDWEQLTFKAKLGSGQFGDVCHMKLLPAGGGLPRNVAVKSLRPMRGVRLDDLKDMRREIKLLGALGNCENVINFEGWGITGARDKDDGGKESRVLFLVEELCKGGSLNRMVAKEMMGKRVYNGSDALSWCIDVALALEHLHNHVPHVIHRDLKLSNVVLRGNKPRLPLSSPDYQRSFTASDNSVANSIAASRASSYSSTVSGTGMERVRPTAVLVDFGLAKPLPSIIGAQRTPSKYKRGSVFHMTGAVGSAVYSAPEVLSKQPYGRRVDIYALAVVMYELFTQTVVSAQLNLDNPSKVNAYVRKVVDDSYRQPIPDRWPASLQVLVKECWAQNPDDRPSAKEVVARLEKIQEDGDVELLFQRGGRETACCAMS